MQAGTLVAAEASADDVDEGLARAARDDLSAFGQLYERRVGDVFRYLRAGGATEDQAAELTAVTFEKALRAIRSYQPKRAGLLAWLLRIARNAAIDAARRSRNAAALDQVPDSDLPTVHVTPEDDAIVRAEHRRLRELVAALPDAQRDAIVLRYASGLSPHEIGAVIGKSESATKKLLSRALARLREDFDEAR